MNFKVLLNVIPFVKNEFELLGIILLDSIDALLPFIKWTPGTHFPSSQLQLKPAVLQAAFLLTYLGTGAYLITLFSILVLCSCS